jgi:2-haloalkanoic acid dehalogenase type II
MKLSDFDALSFDVYGTLIDWEPGILAVLRPWARRNGVEPSDAALLEAFARHQREWEEAHPRMLYGEVLANAHRGIARGLGVAPDDAEAAAFAAAIAGWPAFADSVEALAYLRRHYKLVALSNVHERGIAASATKLGDPFELILTAEAIGSYKPARRNFEVLIERLAEIGVAKEKILHTAQSLHHDHVPANRIGLANAWIDRRAGTAHAGATLPVDPMPHVDFRFESIAELVQAHRAEAA